MTAFDALLRSEAARRLVLLDALVDLHRGYTEERIAAGEPERARLCGRLAMLLVAERSELLARRRGR